MPKQSKTKTTVVGVVEATTVPVVDTVIDVAAVEKVKKVKAPKVKAETVVADSTVQSAVTATTVTDVVEAVDVESDLTAQSTEFLAKLSQLSTLLTSLKVEYRTLEKRWVRELKTAQKTQAKRKRKSGNRAPSGFVKPTKISDELAKFLEKPVGSEMARTDVTREINTYIRKHNLQDKENGRKINPDVKLQTLLKLKKTDELTYFNLQRYMSPHFSKAVKEVVA